MLILDVVWGGKFFPLWFYCFPLWSYCHVLDHLGILLFVGKLIGIADDAGSEFDSSHFVYYDDTIRGVRPVLASSAPLYGARSSTFATGLSRAPEGCS